MATKQTEHSDTDEEFVDELQPGHELMHGQYKIVSFLNAGGFGITYRAEDSLGRPVVIKECFPGSFCRRTETSVRARSRAYQRELENVVDLFVQEAKSLSRLDHPNIVGVHHVFEENSTAYMALDFVEGQDLLQIIEDPTKNLSPKDIEEIHGKVLKAIGFIHDSGMLHRDISPDNILINGDMEPILIDFGAAREEEATQKSRILSAMRVVKDGYSPQEFYISGSMQGNYSDLYALGATFYHLITGELPENSQARLSAIAASESDPYKAVSGQLKEYSAPFLSGIDRALNVLPKDRFASAAEWSAVLSGEKVADVKTGVDGAVAAASVGTSQKSLKGMFLSSAAVVALLIGGFVFHQSMKSSDDVTAAVDASVSTPAASEPAASESNDDISASTILDQPSIFREPVAVASQRDGEDAEGGVPAEETAAAQPAESEDEVAIEDSPAEVPSNDTSEAEENLTALLGLPGATAEADVTDTSVTPEITDPIAVPESSSEGLSESEESEDLQIADADAEEAIADADAEEAIADADAEEVVADADAEEVIADPDAEEVIADADVEDVADEPSLIPLQESPEVTTETAPELIASVRPEARPADIVEAATTPEVEDSTVELADTSTEESDTDVEVAAVEESQDAVTETPTDVAESTVPETVVSDNEIADIIEDLVLGQDDAPVALTENDVDDVDIAAAEIVVEEQLDPALAWMNIEFDEPNRGQSLQSFSEPEVASVYQSFWTIELPDGLTEEGQKIFHVNGISVSDDEEIYETLRGIVPEPTSDEISVSFGVGETSIRTAIETVSVPVLQKSILLNGLAFETKANDGAWATTVTDVPENLGTDLRPGDIIVGDFASEFRFDSRTALNDFREQLDEKVDEQLTLAVRRDGSLVVVTLPNFQ